MSWAFSTRWAEGGFDEVVGAGAGGGIDAAGECEDFAAVIGGGEACGDEGAALEVGFDDDDAQGHAGDDAAARKGKFSGAGRGVEGEF